jgi:hypothetical protein
MRTGPRIVLAQYSQGQNGGYGGSPSYSNPSTGGGESASSSRIGVFEATSSPISQVLRWIGNIWAVILLGVGVRCIQNISVGGAIVTVIVSVVVPIVLLVVFFASLFAASYAASNAQHGMLMGIPRLGT